MSQEITTSCGNCLFWNGGQCRRYPPIVVPYPADNQHPIAYWPAEWRPSVGSSDWCGEWKALQ